MISIITPTYNRRDLLQRTIKSIQAQTNGNWELIVVDDGSTDNTAEVVNTFLSDSRIRYIVKQNTGQAHSLNVGVAHAKGTIITFLDSDDEAYPDWLETVYRNLDHRTGMICMGAIRKMPNGTLLQDSLFPYKFYTETVRIKFTCGSLFIRRSAFEAVGGYDVELKSNIQTDLGYRLVAYLRQEGLEIVSLDEYKVQINIHSGPRIRTNWEKTRVGGIQFYRKHRRYFAKYDKNGLSCICGSIAFSSYKARRRSEALLFLFKAIRYNPLRWVNYFRLLKYSLR